MHHHVVGMGELGECSNFVWGIDGAQFGALGNRHREGLAPVFVTPAEGFLVEALWGELAPHSRNGEELQSTHSLGGSTLVGVDVGC